MVAARASYPQAQRFSPETVPEYTRATKAPAQAGPLVPEVAYKQAPVTAIRRTERKTLPNS